MAMRYYAPYPGGGGHPGRPLGPYALRIGDAERDSAAADLSEHYVAGRLTLDELNERLETVFAAKTYEQLARIMADLPVLRQLPWRPGHPGARVPPAWLPAGWAPPDWAPPGWVPGGWVPGGWVPGGWMPAGTVSAGGNPWMAATRLPGVPQQNQKPRPSAADRAGRLAALSLLLLAMLIWLFTVLVFARHGFYHQVGPPSPSAP